MKIIGQMVCGPNEKWLQETLDEFTRLCDQAIIVTCNATDYEKRLIKKHRFWTYEDNREWGRFQPDIKTDLLTKILRLVPDWILALDADETMPGTDRDDLERIAKGREGTFFYVVDLWNDRLHYSKALSFWNVRYYKADASKGVQFLRKPLHCGNAPPYFYTIPPKKSYTPQILLHKGLMFKEDRLRKVERYQEYDPNAIHKGREYYDALVAESSGSEYNQEKVKQHLEEYCRSL
jgi:hypothetical protein